MWSFKNLSLLLLAGVVSAEEDYYEYQWQNEVIVAQCPTDGSPPFRLDDPSISSRPKGVILTYSAQIPDADWVDFHVFGSDCVNEIPYGSGNDFPMDATLDVGYDDTSTGSSIATLKIELNPEGMQEYGSLFYNENERSENPPYIESNGDATLCVRMSLWNGIPDSENAVEVTFQETIVTFSATLQVTDESFLDFSTAVERSGSGRNLFVKAPTGKSLAGKSQRQRYERRLCEASWGVEVFTCSQNITANSSAVELVEEPNNEPVPKDLLVRLCIQPNEAARAGGVTLKDVRSLYYKTEAGNVQTAVESFSESPDGLTTKDCGDEMCVIETDLTLEFDGSPVLAFGKVHFQPGTVTAYNLIVVDFELPLEISNEAIGGSAAVSVLKKVTFALMWTTFAAIPLLV
jgi:hypothetical protein